MKRGHSYGAARIVLMLVEKGEEEITEEKYERHKEVDAEQEFLKSRPVIFFHEIPFGRVEGER